MNRYNEFIWQVTELASIALYGSFET